MYRDAEALPLPRPSDAARKKNPIWQHKLCAAETSGLHPASNIDMESSYALRRSHDMRKLYVPLTLLGLGGLGWLFLTDRGHQALRWLEDKISAGPDKFLEWNEAAQRELDRIQIALNRVADSLEAAR